MDLHRLPDEITLLILSFLDERAWCAFARVSRACYRLANDVALWSRRVTRFPLLPSSPSARVCHASWLYNGKLFVYGGHHPLPGSNFISDVKNDCYCFDLEKCQWKIIGGTAPFPTRTEHTALVARDRVYIVGGYSGVGGYKMETFAFDLNVDGDWTADVLECRGDVPAARSAHSCVVWKDTLYVFGGWNGAVTNDDFYTLNLKKMKWKKVRDHGQRPTERRSHCACVVGDAMYLFGGYSGVENCFPHLHRFDFVSKKWSVEEVRGLRIPTGRSRARMVSFGTNIVAISGGWDRVNHFQDWWEFNLNTKEWRAFPVEFPSPLGQHTLDVDLNKAYFFGGFHTNSQAASELLWAYSLGQIGRLSNEA